MCSHCLAEAREMMGNEVEAIDYLDSLVKRLQVLLYPLRKLK